MKKLLCAGAVALAMGGFALSANAALVQWTLTNVKFVDGGTASGSYVFDASTNTFSRISISTTATEGIAAASFSNTCNGTNCGFASPAPAAVILFAPANTTDMTGKQVFLVDLEEEMTDAGGTIDINPMVVEEPGGEPEVNVALRNKAFSVICENTSCTSGNIARPIASGQVVGRAFVAPAAATAVPTMTPWSLALLSLLLAPLAWIHKRRQPR